MGTVSTWPVTGRSRARAEPRPGTAPGRRTPPRRAAVVGRLTIDCPHRDRDHHGRAKFRSAGVIGLVGVIGPARLVGPAGVVGLAWPAGLAWVVGPGHRSSSSGPRNTRSMRITSMSGTAEMPQEMAVTVIATLARVYVDDLDVALPTFVELTGEQPGLRFTYRGLHLASIGGYLLLAGSEEALAPYRGTHATTIVESIDQILSITEEHGGEVLDGPNDVPTGRNLTVRHPGGATIEYVQFDATARSSFA